MMALPKTAQQPAGGGQLPDVGTPCVLPAAAMAQVSATCACHVLHHPCEASGACLAPCPAPCLQRHKY
jgi:hypothetical protein